MTTPTTSQGQKPPMASPPSGAQGVGTQSTGTNNTASNNPFLTGLAGMGVTPTYTNTAYLTQTSQPDIESLINGLYQQMVGRYATPEEIQRLGSALLAAERAYPGSYTGETQYQPGGKRAEVSGTQISRGIDPQSFLANLIQGTGDAQEYKMATTYFDAMMQSNDKFKGAFNG